MTPEGKVKARIKKALLRDGVYYHMVVQNGMGKPSLDFIGSRRVTITPEMVGQEVGLFFSVEAKAANKGPTERQLKTISEMVEGGAMVFVVNDVSGTEELEAWLDMEGL